MHLALTSVLVVVCGDTSSALCTGVIPAIDWYPIFTFAVLSASLATVLKTTVFSNDANPSSVALTALVVWGALLYVLVEVQFTAVAAFAATAAMLLLPGLRRLSETSHN